MRNGFEKVPMWSDFCLFWQLCGSPGHLDCVVHCFVTQVLGSRGQQWDGGVWVVNQTQPLLLSQCGRSGDITMYDILRLTGMVGTTYCNSALRCHRHEDITG